MCTHVRIDNFIANFFLCTHRQSTSIFQGVNQASPLIGNRHAVQAATRTVATCILVPVRGGSAAVHAGVSFMAGEHSRPHRLAAGAGAVRRRARLLAGVSYKQYFCYVLIYLPRSTSSAQISQVYHEKLYERIFGGATRELG